MRTKGPKVKTQQVKLENVGVKTLTSRAVAVGRDFDFMLSPTTWRVPACGVCVRDGWLNRATKGEFLLSSYNQAIK